jgi:hypothetical protein
MTFVDHKVVHAIMVLESTQPLTEMSMRDISWGGKVAGV